MHAYWWVTDRFHVVEHPWDKAAPISTHASVTIQFIPHPRLFSLAPSLSNNPGSINSSVLTTLQSTVPVKKPRHPRLLPQTLNKHLLTRNITTPTVTHFSLLNDNIAFKPPRYYESIIMHGVRHTSSRVRAVTIETITYRKEELMIVQEKFCESRDVRYRIRGLLGFWAWVKRVFSG